MGAVVLVGGCFLETRLIGEFSDIETVAIDVPIGYGPREADVLARELVGGSSVFAIPAEERFDAPLAEGGGISAQAHAQGSRIRHVTAIAAHDERFREVHPEVSFMVINEMRRLKYQKSAGGAFERLELLRKHGISIDLNPASLGAAATVPLDDLLGAAACAWTAAREDVVSLLDPPEARDGLAVAIWYERHHLTRKRMECSTAR